MDPAKRAKRIALGVMGALLLCAVPYSYAIFTKYRGFSDYVRVTLDEGTPAWEAAPHTPEQCVLAGVDWIGACPGEDVFCEGAFRRVLRECMASQDRAAWCEAQAGAWAATKFGYHDCERLVAAADGPDRAALVDDYCGDGFRGVAAHCKALQRADASR